MKKIKYVIAMLMAILLSVSLFGCGDGTTEEVLENGVVNIRLSKAGYGRGWIDAAIEGFEREYKIKVNVTETPDLTNSLSILLDQKVANPNKNVEVDDLYFVSLLPADWMKWTEYGKIILEPLDDLECVSRLDPEVKKWGSRNINGTDRLYVIHPNIALETFIYNKAYLEKIDSYGEYKKGEWPTTWQGLLDLCYQLVVNMDGKIDGKKVYPYAMFLAPDFEPQKLYETLFAQGNGGEDYKNFWNFEFLTSTLTEDVKKIFVNDSFAEAMWALDRFLQVDNRENGMPKYYKVYQGGTTISGDVEAIRGFLAGEALFCWHGSFFGTEASALIESPAINKIGDNFHIGVVPAISGNEKDRTINLNWPHECLIIPNFAPNKENAKKFLDYIYRDENIINIVKTLNAIPAFGHTFTEAEKATMSRWTRDVVETYEKFSNKENYPNGITFRNSTSRPYRAALLNSLNFNGVGEPMFFGYVHCSQSDYNKSSKAEYLAMLDELFESGIRGKKWSEWLERFPPYYN